MGDMLRTMTFRGADWLQDMQRALDVVAWVVRTTINLYQTFPLLLGI